MSGVTEGAPQTIVRASAICAAALAGLRALPCLLLALLLGVLNPAFCLLHCYLTHSDHAAHGSVSAHSHHGREAAHTDHEGAAHLHEGCRAAGLPEASLLTPRVAYELVPASLALAIVVLALAVAAPRPWRRFRSAPPSAPPTPPPQILAFV